MSNLGIVKNITEPPERTYVVRLLRETLEKAEKGDVLSLAMCYIDNDERSNIVFINDSSRSGLRDLVAGTQLLLFRITSRWNE